MPVEIGYIVHRIQRLRDGEVWIRGGKERWVATAAWKDDCRLCCCLEDGFTAYFRGEKEVECPNKQ